MYAGLGASFILPVIQAISIFGWGTQMSRMSLDWLALMTALNLMGGVVYAMRVGV
jgi:adiponectin receptor